MRHSVFRCASSEAAFHPALTFLPISALQLEAVFAAAVHLFASIELKINVYFAAIFEFFIHFDKYLIDKMSKRYAFCHQCTYNILTRSTLSFNQIFAIYCDIMFGNCSMYGDTLHVRYFSLVQKSSFCVSFLMNQTPP